MALLKRLDTVFLLVIFLVALFSLARGGKMGITKMRGSGETVIIKMGGNDVVSENRAGQPCTEYMCEKAATNEDVPCWCCGPPLAFGTCSFDQTLCLVCNQS
ncbi:hypothetical protein V2J09_020567 [Rumex salicifolius]